MLHPKRALPLLFVLAAGVIPQAKAGLVTLFDNTSDTNGSPIGIGGSLPLGDSFSTGGAPITLTNVTVLLELGGSAIGSTTFTLNADTGGSGPGSVISTVGTIADSSLTDSIAAYSFNNLDVDLSESTRYWIEATTSSSNAEWSSAAIGDGTGVSGEFFNQGSLHPGSDDGGPFNMTVQGDATPEPGTLPLLGSGLAFALGWTRRRWSRRSTK